MTGKRGAASFKSKQPLRELSPGFQTVRDGGVDEWVLQIIARRGLSDASRSSAGPIQVSSIRLEADSQSSTRV